MKTFLKTVAALLVLLLVIILALNLYFTDDRLKSTVMPYVDEAVGRTVNVESMSLTFFSTFPQPGISIQKMSIPGETESDTLLSLDELVASVELFSLMGDQINISEITLRNPQFTYVVNENGTTNIDFLMESEETEQDTSAGASINIPYFNVIGGNFGYRDATSGTNIQFRDLNADISLNYSDLIKSTIDMELGGLYTSVGDNTYLNGLPMSLSQQSSIDMENETVTLEKGTFSIRGLALNLTGSISNWSNTMVGDLKFNSSSDNFGELLRLVPAEYEEYIEGLESRGSLSIDGTIQGALAGEQLPDFDVAINVTDGYIKYPDLPKPIQNIQLTANASNEVLSLEMFTAEAVSNSFSMRGKINQPLKEGQRNINLQTELDFDLATIKDFYPIDEDTLSMRGNLTANATLKGSADQIERAVQSGNISLSNGYINHTSFGKPIENITLQSNLSGPTLSISEASFQTGENNLSVTGSVTNYLSDSRSVDLKIDGNAALNQLTEYYKLEPNISKLTGLADMNLRASGPIANPAEMKFEGQLTVQNINMDGEAMVQPVTNLNGDLTLSPASANLKSLKFKIGSSDIALSGSLQNYMAYLQAEKDRETTPHFKGSYKSELLNLDELINWEDTTTTEIPIELPDLTSSVTAEISKMIVTGVTLTNLEGEGGTTTDQIKLDKATAQLLDGKANGSFTWDVPQPDRTMISFKGSLDSLQAKTFFEEFQVLGEKSKFHEHISGAFSANVDYFSELNVYLDPVIETSKMNGNFGMTKARLKGHPLQERLASLLKANEFKNVALDEWKSTYTLDNSIFTIKDLRLTSGDIGMELNGTQHMVNGTIDFQTKLFLPNRYKNAIASVITKRAADALTQENGTIMLPLRITGTQDNPNISPDKKVITPIVKDFLKNKAGDVLKSLFDGNR